MHLLTATSRGSLIKLITILRIEVMAASIGVKLLISLKIFFQQPMEEFYWTDFTTLLAWIQQAK